MTKQIIPELSFRSSNTDEVISLINYFLIGSWKERVFEQYPRLRKKLSKVRSRRKRDIIVYTFFREQEAKADFDKKTKSFQKTWDKINNKVMRTLSEVVEIPWSQKYQNLSARVSLNPISPRYLDFASFDVYYHNSPAYMKKCVLHELLHFIYFIKWQKVFPKCSKEEYEYPHLVWCLSEMVTKAILGDARIQNIYKHSPAVYSEFDDISIEGIPVLNHIQDFYDNRKSFTHFLRTSYAFVKRHKSNVLLDLD